MQYHAIQETLSSRVAYPSRCADGAEGKVVLEPADATGLSCFAPGGNLAMAVTDAQFHVLLVTALTCPLTRHSSDCLSWQEFLSVHGRRVTLVAILLACSQSSPSNEHPPKHMSHVGQIFYCARHENKSLKMDILCYID